MKHGATDRTNRRAFWARYRAHWFLIGLAVCLIAGYLLRDAARDLADAKLWQHLVVASVMFLMAISIDFAVVRSTMRRPWAPLLACGINLGFAPLLVWPVLPWLGPELGPGFAVAAATPCTLASAAVWTRRAGGNEVVAILVTLLTNLACFWVLPAWLRILTAGHVATGDLGSVAWLLFWIVVLPIVAAQLARRSRAVAQGVHQQRNLIGVLCQLGVLTIVFVGSIKMFGRMDAANADVLSGWDWMTSAVVALALHLTLFATGFFVARGSGMRREEQLAVAFSGSQKTLMVGLSAAIELGYSILPLVLYHVLQLLADTLLANRLRRKS